MRRKCRRHINYILNNWSKEKYYQHISWLQVQSFANLKKGAKHGKSLPDNAPSAVPSAVPTPVKSNSEVPSFVNVLEDKLPAPQNRKAPSLARTKQTVPSIIATSPTTPTYSKMSGKFVLPPKQAGAIHIAGYCSHSLFCPTRQCHSNRPRFLEAAGTHHGSQICWQDGGCEFHGHLHIGST